MNRHKWILVALAVIGGFSLLAVVMSGAQAGTTDAAAPVSGQGTSIAVRHRADEARQKAQAAAMQARAASSHAEAAKSQAESAKQGAAVALQRATEAQTQAHAASAMPCRRGVRH